MPDPDATTTAAVAQFAEGVATEPCECGCGYDVPDWPEDMQYAYHAGRASERQRIRTAVFDNPADLIGPRRHREPMMNWRQRALHAALEDDNAR